ncbi:uncharacterized protein METZ01_LOCUS204719, partial [marine metagenome]
SLRNISQCFLDVERPSTIYLLRNYIHFYGKDTVSSLIYFYGSIRNWDLCLGGVCLNFTGIKDFRLPIKVVGQAF